MNQSGAVQDFIAERASGSYVWTTDGQKHLDMATGTTLSSSSLPFDLIRTKQSRFQLLAGIGVVSTGHCHPKVVKAIQDQAANLIFAQQNVFAGTGPMVCFPSLTQIPIKHTSSDCRN